jgi:3-deoxy-manno-octulosonate cytidylyltransferase (CMP-KDO synthetase)
MAMNEHGDGSLSPYFSFQQGFNVFPMAHKASVAVVIPARYGSTRFPGKPLALLAGKPMIQHVYERVRQASAVSKVLVATDDERILEAVKDFGGTAVLTSRKHLTGTDRAAEVAAELKEDVVVNVQGDEPLISPRAVDAAVEPLLGDASLQMSTLAHHLDGAWEMNDPDVVKVVCDAAGFAIDFFRRPEAGAGNRAQAAEVLRHIGLYGFRRAYLLKLAAMEPTRRERDVGLEQLRPLEDGCRIKVVASDYVCLGVDRPEDIERAERLIAAEADRLAQTEKEAQS